MKTVLLIIVLAMLSTTSMADRVIEDFNGPSGLVLTTTGAGDITWGLGVDSISINSIIADTICAPWWGGPRYIHHHDSSLVRHRIECDTITERRYKHEGWQVEEYEVECDTFFHWEKFPVYAPKVQVYLDSAQWQRLLDMVAE